MNRLIAAVFSLACVASAFPNGYTYRRSITVAGAVVPSTQTNFPMLVSGTYAYLATAANGGLIQHTTTLNGQTVPADLIFTSDSAGTTLLNWEVASYTATSGAIEVWVKIPSLSNGSVIYEFYDASPVSTYQGNATSTWDANYKVVYHFGDGVTLSGGDSTTTAKTLTINGAVASAGRIDGGADTTAAHYLAASDAGLPSGGTAFTISGWYKTSTGSTTNILLNYGGGGSPEINQVYTGIYNLGNGFDAAIVGNGTVNLGDNVSLNDGVWHYIVATNDGSNGTKLFVDGALKVSGNSIPWATVLAGANRFVIGRDQAGTQTYAGSQDELRISDTNRPANWIAAEYNNQNNPPVFYTIGAAAGSGNSFLVLR